MMFDPSIGKERIYVRAAKALEDAVFQLDGIFAEEASLKRSGMFPNGEAAASWMASMSPHIKRYKDEISRVIYGAAVAANAVKKDGVWHEMPIDREHTFEAHQRIHALARLPHQRRWRRRGVR